MLDELNYMNHRNTHTGVAPTHPNTNPTQQLSPLPVRLVTAAFTALAPALVLMLTLTASTPAQAQTVVNICDRNATVEAALIATDAVTVSDCTMVTDTMLNGVTSLNLAHNATAGSETSTEIGSLLATDFANLTDLTELNLSFSMLTQAELPSSVFASLTSLTSLNLSSNSLTTLTASVFTGLGALTTLNLSDNQLTTSLPSGSFAQLVKMTSLDLSGNQFDALPPGLFARLTVPLKTVDLRRQFEHVSGATVINSLPLVVNIRLLSNNQVRAQVANNIPATLTVNPRIEGTVNFQGAATQLGIQIQFKQTERASAIQTPHATIPLALKRNNDAHRWATGSTFHGINIVHDFFAGICSTTTALKDALIANNQVTTTDCGLVTRAMLNAVTSLNLSGKTLTSVPATEIFSLVPFLTGLNLSNNSLTSVPASDFTQFARLTSLNLSNNSLASLSGDNFISLVNLTSLNLSGNSLTGLPAGLFDGLTKITNLNLNGNQFATLPASLFANLTAMTDLNLSGNQLATLPADFFNGLTKITDLNLSGNQFATLPAGLFANLAAITDLNLSGNQLATLPDGIFSGLGTITDLDLTGNSVTSFPLEVKLSPVAGKVQVDLPFRAASVTVYAQTDAGTLHTITPGTPVTIAATTKTVQINNVCFDETPTDANTGAGCTGIDTTADATFKGVQLASGFELAVDAIPRFSAQIANQEYYQQVTIAPLQLPQVGFLLPPGVTTPPSLTYSLSATITGGEEAQLTTGNLPAGLAFSANTRTLTGTPAALGTYAMTYTATDNNGDTDSLTFVVEVAVIPVDYDALHAQILSHLAMTVADSAGQAVSDRIDRMFSTQKPRFSRDSSEFEFSLSGRGSIFTLWLQDSSTDLSLKGGDFNWGGDVSGTQFGFDWRSDNAEFLVGLMLQNLDGKFNYSSNVAAAADSSGYYSTPVDSEHVYFAWMPGGVETSNWLNVWGMLGSGSGSLAMTGRNGVAMRGSTDLSMTHLGFSMTPVTRSDWLSLRVRGEMTISSLKAGGGGVTPLKVSATRQRALVEPSLRDLIADDRHRLVLAGELGFRSDSTSVKGVAKPGGVPEGVGTELGMKLSYSWRNFDVQVGFRQMSTSSGGHKYNEDGFYFSLTMGTLFDERGWTASLRPTWGDTGSGVTQLWQADKVAELGSSGDSVDAFDSSGSMQAQLSYGMLSPFGGSGLLIPYSTVQTSDSGATNATLGMNLTTNSGWQLNWEYSGSGSAAQSATGIDSLGATSSSASGAFKLGAKLDF